MSKIVIQMGHVPRKTGATGTHREQEFNKLVGPRLVENLKALGHDAVLIGADDTVPACDVFVALHTDGNVNANTRGGSVGYPSDDPKSDGGRLAQAWKRHHQANGFPGGFNPDNYTKGLRYYYGFRKSSAKFEFLAEHGTTTNKDDETWLFSHLDECVKAHVDAIGEVVGHPGSAPTHQTPISVEEEEMNLWFVRGPQGDVYIFNGETLRAANDETYRNIAKMYGVKGDPWQEWSQEQINAVPKVQG